jgi:hypothetical protein
MENVHARRAKRLALASAAAFAAVNIWTGAPLLALWIGSRFVGQTRLSMGAVVIVVIALAVCVYSLVFLLGRLNTAYMQLVDPVGSVRRETTPWLRSMRGERATEARGFNLIERISVISVGICAVVFNIWFFFLAGSSLPSG